MLVEATETQVGQTDLVNEDLLDLVFGSEGVVETGEHLSEGGFFGWTDAGEEAVFGGVLGGGLFTLFGTWTGGELGVEAVGVDASLASHRDLLLKRD